MPIQKHPLRWMIQFQGHCYTVFREGRDYSPKATARFLQQYKDGQGE